MNRRQTTIFLGVLAGLSIGLTPVWILGGPVWVPLAPLGLLGFYLWSMTMGRVLDAATRGWCPRPRLERGPVGDRYDEFCRGLDCLAAGGIRQ